jgi:hypothetical protein
LEKKLKHHTDFATYHSRHSIAAGGGSMKKHILTAGALSIFLAIGLCLSMAAEQLPSTNPAEFWTYISKTNPYKNWQHWPGFPGKVPGKSPHGAYVELYANDIAVKAANEGKDMPDGAILVKENYAKDKETLMEITPMYKVKGYNPDAGDWFWTEYGPAGKVMNAGKVDSCINCHRKGKDFRFRLQ